MEAGSLGVLHHSRLSNLDRVAADRAILGIVSSSRGERYGGMRADIDPAKGTIRDMRDL